MCALPEDRPAHAAAARNVSLYDWFQNCEGIQQDGDFVPIISYELNSAIVGTTRVAAILSYNGTTDCNGRHDEHLRIVQSHFRQQQSTQTT
jgi:hypothetical protein